MNMKLKEFTPRRPVPTGICKGCLPEKKKREIITGEDQGDKKYRENKEQRSQSQM